MTNKSWEKLLKNLARANEDWPIFQSFIEFLLLIQFERRGYLNLERNIVFTKIPHLNPWPNKSSKPDQFQSIGQISV